MFRKYNIAFIVSFTFTCMYNFLITFFYAQIERIEIDGSGKQLCILFWMRTNYYNFPGHVSYHSDYGGYSLVTPIAVVEILVQNGNTVGVGRTYGTTPGRKAYKRRKQ